MAKLKRFKKGSKSAKSYMGKRYKYTYSIYASSKGRKKRIATLRSKTPYLKIGNRRFKYKNIR